MDNQLFDFFIENKFLILIICIIIFALFLYLFSKVKGFGIDNWLYVVDGRFWSGKTLILARWISKLYKDPRNIIFTNIKLHWTSPNITNYVETITVEGEYYDYRGQKKKQPDQIFFWLSDVLATIVEMDQARRDKIEKFAKDKKIPLFIAQAIFRPQRLKYYIMDDEAGIILDNYSRESLPETFKEKLLQVRKINTWLIFGAQRVIDVARMLRKHFNGVFYFEPLFSWKFLKRRSWSIRFKEVDFDTGQTIAVPYLTRDENGNDVTEYRPIDYRVEWLLWKPRYYWIYDDLYLNKKFTIEERMQNFDTVQGYIYALTGTIYNFLNKLPIKKIKPKFDLPPVPYPKYVELSHDIWSNEADPTPNFTAHLLRKETSNPRGSRVPVIQSL